jgi:hypothetical protein
VAPAYALTATIGILVAETGTKMAVVIIAGFLPMFFAAYAYRELNKVAPDCGTSFTWTTKAFGPYVGWIGGWAAILATAIVLSNLAGVAVQFLYQFLGDLFNNDDLGGLWQNRLVNVLTVAVLLSVATWVAYRGITTTERVQFVLVGFQMVILLVFAVLAFAKSGSSETGVPFSFDWFSPSGLTLSAFIAGLSGSIFAFWGWDTCLTVNEESKDADKTPGRAALLTVLSILLTYLIVATATQMYAGVGTEGLGLGNEEISDNVFGALAEPVMGSPWNLLLFLAVLASSAVSLITTFLPTSRTMLGMSAYRGPAGAVRDDPSPVPDAVVRDRGGRPGRRAVLRGAHLRERERAHRHDLLAGHHDLLLLRADRVRLHLVLPQGVVHQLLELRLQVPVPAARRHRPVRRPGRHAARQRVPGLRQRRERLRGRSGAGPGFGPDHPRRLGSAKPEF